MRNIQKFFGGNGSRLLIRYQNCNDGERCDDVDSKTPLQPVVVVLQFRPHAAKVRFGGQFATIADDCLRNRFGMFRFNARVLKCLCGHLWFHMWCPCRTMIALSKQAQIREPRTPSILHALQSDSPDKTRFHCLKRSLRQRGLKISDLPNSLLETFAMVLAIILHICRTDEVQGARLSCKQFSSQEIHETKTDS